MQGGLEGFGLIRVTSIFGFGLLGRVDGVQDRAAGGDGADDACHAATIVFMAMMTLVYAMVIVTVVLLVALL